MKIKSGFCRLQHQSKFEIFNFENFLDCTFSKIYIKIMNFIIINIIFCFFHKIRMNLKLNHWKLINSIETNYLKTMPIDTRHKKCFKFLDITWSSIIWTGTLFIWGTYRDLFFRHRIKIQHLSFSRWCISDNGFIQSQKKYEYFISCLINV